MIKIKEISDVEDGREDVILKLGEGKLIIQQELYIALGADFQQLRKIEGLSAFLISLGLFILKNKESP